MPHIKVNLSASVARPGRFKPFLAELANTLGSFESIEPAAVKAYLVVNDHFATTAEGPPGFAHIEVSLMRGRPLEMRQQIGAALRSILEAEFEEKVAHGEISLTVEVREMDPETYIKGV